MTLQNLATDLKIGILFCTRVPLFHAASIGSGDVARASWAFPLAGAVVGGIGAIVYWIAYSIGLSPAPAAALALVATVTATGCLHEDGLADTADGFGGGQDRASKLAIMRDSRLGTYGACALGLSLLLRWSAIAAIARPAAVAVSLIAAHVAARAALPPFMLQVPPARPDGLSADAGRPPPQAAAAAAVLGAAALWFILGPVTGIVALVVVAASGGVMAWLCLRQIDGQTGDVLGALEQVNEIVILLAAAALPKVLP
jgi:adenosylcobinamide-GDP ribazoletransferase